MKYSEYKENKRHGSENFPMQYYFVDRSHPQYVMPLHWHREMEIIRVISGTIAIYINNEEYILGAGDIVLVAPGCLHRGEPVDCVYDCVVFDLRMISGYNVTAVSDMIHRLISSEVEIDPICTEIVDIAGELLDTVVDGEQYYELKASYLAAELIQTLYALGEVRSCGAENKRLAHRRAQMALLIEKIEKDYTSKITLSSLASIAQINEKYLCRFFKEFTGQTPIDYVNRLRIDRACYDMTVNKMNVTEAAFECGFNELSYFSKIFKKYKGITPGQYRERYAKE